MNKQEYAAYLKSQHWIQLREAKRDSCARTGTKNRCAICASTERIETHHLNYRNIYDVTTSDLRLLCRDCHQAAHDLMAASLTFKSTKHHSIFATLKNAVKKHRGLGNRNMFTSVKQVPESQK